MGRWGCTHECMSCPLGALQPCQQSSLPAAGLGEVAVLNAFDVWENGFLGACDASSHPRTGVLGLVPRLPLLMDSHYR